ncbi:MAG: hypothetical protein J6K81_02420 [Rikenellaceae bacterium]|nr:hypothetical protein [Rikenellaceae bacterium]
MKRYIFILLTTLLMFVGCTPGMDENFLSVEKNSVRIGSDPIEMTLKVKAGGTWSAESDSEWCTATAKGGLLTLEINENLDHEPRVANITLKCGESIVMVRVSQRAFGKEDHIEAMTNPLIVSSVADTIRIAVEANDEWSVELDHKYDWCKITKEDPTTLCIALDVNQGEERKATAMLICGDAETEFSVTQECCANVLVAYFMGSNNLSQALLSNMVQMEQAVSYGALKGGRILVFLDRFSGSAIYELVDKGGTCSRTMLKNYDNVDCTDPEVMRTVLSEVKRLAPAKSYGFVFGGHANGWVADSLDMSDMNSYSTEWKLLKRPTTQEVAEHEELEHYGLWMKRHVEGDWKTRAVGYDGSRGMDIAEFAEALGVLRPEFVLMDACFMASVEALWELRGVTDKVIASPIEIMSIGFPYTPIIGSLFGDWDNLEQLCQIYIDTYKASAIPYAAVSLIDINRLEGLAKAVKEVMKSAEKVDKSWLDDVDKLQYYEGLVNHVFYDLGDCMEHIATDSVALQDFRTALSETVLWTGHTEKGYSDFSRGDFPLKRCSGLSTYVVRPQYHGFRATYLQTGWAQNAGAITSK